MEADEGRRAARLRTLWPGDKTGSERPDARYSILEMTFDCPRRTVRIAARSYNSRNEVVGTYEREEEDVDFGLVSLDPADTEVHDPFYRLACKGLLREPPGTPQRLDDAVGDVTEVWSPPGG